MDSNPAAVAAAVGRPDAVVSEFARVPLEYDVFFAHRTVSRVRGEAVVDGAVIPWSMIEKRTEGPDRAAPYLYGNARREFDAYRSGVLDDLAPGIRAPRLYDSDLDPDGGITLWLEDVHHDGPRPFDMPTILAAAHDLGTLGGRWIERALDDPWYFTGWIDRHAQPEAVDRASTFLRGPHPAASERLGDRLTDIRRLIRAQPRVRRILESLPRTLCHHDAVGANVFRSRGSTVLIDWESVGPGPVGADLASLLFSSVNRGDAMIATVTACLDDAVVAYADGIVSECPRVSPDDVRRGFDAAVALRWKLAVDVARGIERGQSWRRGSRPDEDSDAAREELIRLVDVLLASAAHILG